MTIQAKKPSEHRDLMEAYTSFACAVAVEAGAGTGKTAVLVARVVAWCLGPGWSRAKERLSAEEAGDTVRVASMVVDRVVAITFTDAAAAEMTERVGASFRDLSQGKLPLGIDVYETDAADPQIQTRARALLGVLDRLSLSTIHAYCRNLLLRFPFQARLRPSFQVDADGRLLEESVQEVVEEALRAPEKAELRGRIFFATALGYDPPKIAEAVRALASTALESGDLECRFFAQERIDALIGRLTLALSGVQDLVGTRFSGSKRAKNGALIAEGVQNTLRTLETAGKVLPLEAVRDALHEAFPDNLRSHLAKWGKGRFSQAEGLLLGDAVDALAVQSAKLHRLLSHIKRIREDIYEVIAPIFSEMSAEVRERMRIRGAHTFSWLLRDAYALLRDHPDTLRSVRGGMDQLLVDEFQDTDPLQCALVRTLALTGSPKERPGLFVVGDPKQSIYGWRNADIRAYVDFVSEVVEQGGVEYTLTMNYRSAVAVLDEVERVMSPVMKPREGVQPPFVALTPSPKAVDGAAFQVGDRAHVEHWVSWGWDEESQTPEPQLSAPLCAALEARAVARDIAKLRKDGVIKLWSEVAILFRSTGDLETYLGALRDAGIPYIVERDRSYYRRREIIEAAALMRVIVDPCDELALLTFLRSAIVGVPDAALLPLWRVGLPGLFARLEARSPEIKAEILEQIDSVRQDLPTEVPGLERVQGWALNLNIAVGHLSRLRRSFLEDSADLFVDRVRESFLLEITEAARYLGAYRVANLDRFFGDCLGALQESKGDVDALLNSLRRNIQESREAEEAKPGDAANNAVQIMTIHKSKGLAFEHVYCVQLHKESGGAPSLKPADLEVAHGTGVLEASFFGAVSPGFDLLEAQRLQVEQAERVRTLYVAMTRTRKRLVMVGRWRREPASEIRSHIDLLSHRNGSHIDLFCTMETLAEEGRSTWDDEGVRWVFPALDPEETAPGSAQSWSDQRPPPGASMEHIHAASLSLSKHRASAEARMRRGFGASASGEKAGEDHPSIYGWETHLTWHIPDAFQPARVASNPGVSAAVGTAVHGLLEHINLHEDPDEELARCLAALRARVEGLVDPDLRVAVWEGSCAVMQKLVVSSLWEYFYALREQIIARELPVLVPPDDRLSSAVGYLSGFVDLIYRDPADNTVVVVDYKTDRLESPELLSAFARRYERQGQIYAHAIKDALALDYEPRFELWFLSHGTILRGTILKGTILRR